ncbi:unnamed protein product, partial [Mesorhabditis spiculigera]
NLGSSEASGGFYDDDDQVAERFEEIAQKRQRRIDARAPSIPLDDCQLCQKPIIEFLLPDRSKIRCAMAAETVIDRMLEVHGSYEGLEDANQLQGDKRTVKNERNFEKKLKDMRKQIRGAGKNIVVTKKAHIHAYGDEIEVDAAAGEWKRECAECGYTETFEKM